MLAVHQIATEAATRAESFAAELAQKAGWLNRLASKAASSINAAEAASAGIFATLGLYGLAFCLNVALTY